MKTFEYLYQKQTVYNNLHLYNEDHRHLYFIKFKEDKRKMKYLLYIHDGKGINIQHTYITVN